MVTRHETATSDVRWGDGERGFTLVELLVVTVMTLLILAATVTLTSQVQSGYTYELEQASAEQEGRYALDWITRLLRQAGTNSYGIRTGGCLPTGLPAGNAYIPVIRDPNGTGADNSIRILADVNPPNRLIGGTAPGNCTELGEDLTVAHDAAARTITLRDNNLTGSAATPQTDAVISNLRFSYLNAARVATTDMRQVTWVRVEVTAQARARLTPTGQQPVYRFVSEVMLRAR
jgi:prepilin-type N-terminal cleavage/methylation domain-containing protein